MRQRSRESAGVCTQGRHRSRAEESQRPGATVHVDGLHAGCLELPNGSRTSIAASTEDGPAADGLEQDVQPAAHGPHAAHDHRE